MPFPPAHTDLIFSGVFGLKSAPAEIWSYGIALDIGPFDQAAFTTLTNAASVAWTTHTAQLLSSDVRLTRIRAVSVTADRSRYGFKADGSYALVDKEMDAPAAGAAGKHPFQVALAISLVSVNPGPTGRGRYYLPLPTLPPLQGGRMPLQSVSDWLSNQKSFLDAINAGTPAGSAGIVIASGGSVKQGKAPALYTVSKVRVGSVPDTMRSRRNALQEAYQEGVLA